VGALFLAGNNLGFNAWMFLWPILIIAAGLMLVLGTLRTPVAAPQSESAAIPLGSAEKAVVKIHHGAGRLSVSGGAGIGNLVEGSFSGGVNHTENLQGSTLYADLRVPRDVWSNAPFCCGGWTPIDWHVRVASGIPMSLEFETGAGESQLDLQAVKAESIVLKTGASSTNITLPAQAGRTRLQVESGAAAVNIRVPEGVAARVSVESGLAGISVDPVRFPRMGDVYQSADYETAAHRVEILARTGVGSLDIR
jgi:hypothetical protein